MTAFTFATQQRLRGGAAGFRAACARSTDLALPEWALNRHWRGLILGAEFRTYPQLTPTPLIQIPAGLNQLCQFGFRALDRLTRCVKTCICTRIGQTAFIKDTYKLRHRFGLARHWA